MMPAPSHGMATPAPSSTTAPTMAAAPTPLSHAAQSMAAPQAVLALEAAVQQQPEDSIAWQTLGQAHADSDDDQQAIASLRRAVSSDPHVTAAAVTSTSPP